MKEFKYVIKDPEGIHIRPAGIFVKLCEGFQSDIEIEKQGKAADAKRIMRVMGLGVTQGTEVTIRCTGPDEEEAAKKLEEFFKENM